MNSAPIEYPPRDQWPELTATIALPTYPERFNACDYLLDAHVRSGQGGAVAVRFRDQSITYDLLLEKTARVAGCLRARGIRAGDRVLLRLCNRPEFVVSWLAVVRLGAVVVATPPLIRAREIGAIVSSARPAAVIVDDELTAELDASEPVNYSRLTLSALWDQASIAQPAGSVPVEPDAPALIGYTSGSTGDPKRCIHSHAAVMAVCDTYAAHVLRPVPSDRFSGHPTLAFVYGLGGLLLFPLRFGAATVLLDRFTPDAMVDTVRDHRVTVAFCAPTSLRMMLSLDRDLKSDLSSLRLCISAGETLPATVYETWMNRTGIEVLDGIGATETLHMFISNRPGRSRPGTTGEIVPGYEARVTDESGNNVPDDTPGLLAVRGPTGCRYLGLPVRQREYVREGWNYPGDIYIRDASGYFRYQCRNDDLIISGGVNIAGPEIEAVLIEHPAVAETAVVAMPDSVKGMVPKAFVVLRDGRTAVAGLEEELRAFVKERLAPYKVPRHVEFVPALPRTSTGKIQRTLLRKSEFSVK